MKARHGARFVGWWALLRVEAVEDDYATVLAKACGLYGVEF